MNAGDGLVDASGVPNETMPARPSTSGWVVGLMHLALGAVTVGLAASPDFAAGKAVFASEASRAVFGLVGAALVFLSLRGMIRMLNGTPRTISPELRRRSAVRGRVLIAAGVAFFVVALVDAAGDVTVSLSGWAKPFYLVGAVYLVLIGLVVQWDPTRFARQQRVARGEGLPGIARIVGASDTGRSVNDMPQVKIDFELEVGGRTHLVSDKIVMERAKLALLLPGSTVDVLVDRVDPNVFHIDWTSWRAPHA